MTSKKADQSMQPAMFENPLGKVQLQRWPVSKSNALQPWDGVDRLLLAMLAEQPQQGAGLVLNDASGGLVVPVLDSGMRIALAGDSVIANASVRQNLELNAIAPEKLKCLWSDEIGLRAWDFALVKIPGSLSLLDYQLSQLASVMASDAEVWVGGMDKHTPPDFAMRLGRWLDDVVRLPGRFKAHVYRGKLREGGAAPECNEASFSVPGLALPVRARPGVFAWRQLDIGARLLLENIPDVATGHVVDLGCGAGILGLVAAMRNPHARVTLVDESRQAFLSAQENAARLFPGRDILSLHQSGGKGLAGMADLVLLNPPFHRGRAVDQSAGVELVEAAAGMLRPDGELRMVVNRHLDYRGVLGKRFRVSEIVASNPKFVVFRAIC